ncbi:MmgE/PrpD family protein [Desulfobacula sp.]|uniref:MmgE/PrpD family protein n=1 Tax=Desulfobacula sp. TaxID=2593537 RepID=UPI0026034F48|nr:MmgE/PrpD family protein [Desulfobacula sp.]
MSIMDQLAAFVFETDFQDIPDETVLYTKALTSKIVAAMLTGSTTVAGKRIIKYTESKNAPGEIGAIGSGKKFLIEDAIFINGITSHAAELEDDQFPSATSDITIFPVIFPLAEKLNLTGKEVITAAALGIEVMNRIGMFTLSSKGYTDLPFYGVIGASVTAGKALGLDREQLKNAMGIAMGCASGFIINFGTDAHYIESAVACRNGLMAAQLAKMGMTGSWDVEKWLSQMCTGHNYDAKSIVKDLAGARWRVHETWIKKYPCCFLTHRHIDMMLEILVEQELTVDAIDIIKIHVGPVDNTCNRPEPIHTEDARFSFHHIMAALMIDGDVNSCHFSQEVLQSYEFQKAWKKVIVINHSEWPAEFMSGIAKIEVLLTDGRKITKERVQAKGGPDSPLTIDEVHLLYEKYTSDVLPPDDMAETWQMIIGLENHDNLNALLEKLIYIQ